MCTEYPKAREFINKLSNIANFTKNGTHGAFMLFQAFKGMKEEFQPDITTDPDSWIWDGVEVEFSDQIDLEHYQRTVNETIQNIYGQRPDPCFPPNSTFACCSGYIDFCCTGRTDIIRALNGALSMMFQNSSGMREDAEQVATLITDGIDTDEEGEPIIEGHKEYPELIQNYVEMAEKFKEKKIKILAIGVGDVSEETLNILVQSPENFIKVDTFDNLIENLTDRIGAIICKGM